MIDVIIPAYNAHEYIIDALLSVLFQSIISKVNVYIVNDCSFKDYSKEIELFNSKMSIKEIKTKKNSGPGAARQLGVEKSSSEFIVFLDADDMFLNRYALEDLLDSINNTKSDVVISNFIEEYDGGSETHYNNNIWMHGKIYRRSFLESNNIKFNNSYSNEDTGFNTLVSLCTDKISYVDTSTYVWKYNENSITRKNNSEFEFYGLKGFISNICWAVKEAIKRNIDENKIAKVLYETIIEIYYNYIKFSEDENKNLIIDWSSELKQLFLEYKDKIDEEIKYSCEYSIINKCIGIAGPDKILNNKLSFDEFLNMIH